MTGVSGCSQRISNLKYDEYTRPKFQRRDDGFAVMHDPNRALPPSPSAEKVRQMPLLSSTGPYINSICDCWSAALEAAFFYSRFRYPTSRNETPPCAEVQKFAGKVLSVSHPQRLDAAAPTHQRLFQREIIRHSFKEIYYVILHLGYDYFLLRDSSLQFHLPPFF